MYSNTYYSWDASGSHLLGFYSIDSKLGGRLTFADFYSAPCKLVPLLLINALGLRTQKSPAYNKQNKAAPFGEQMGGQWPERYGHGHEDQPPVLEVLPI